MYLNSTCGNSQLASNKAGLGCADCGGKCGGLGLFDSMDISTWGFGEWGLLAAGAYVLLSVYSTTKRGAQAVSRKARGVRRGLKS